MSARVSGPCGNQVRGTASAGLQQRDGPAAARGQPERGDGTARKRWRQCGAHGVPGAARQGEDPGRAWPCAVTREQGHPRCAERRRGERPERAAAGRRRCGEGALAGQRGPGRASCCACGRHGGAVAQQGKQVTARPRRQRIRNVSQRRVQDARRPCPAAVGRRRERRVPQVVAWPDPGHATHREFCVLRRAPGRDTSCIPHIHAAIPAQVDGLRRGRCHPGPSSSWTGRPCAGARPRGKPYAPSPVLCRWAPTRRRQCPIATSSGCWLAHRAAVRAVLARGGPLPRNPRQGRQTLSAPARAHAPRSRSGSLAVIIGRAPGSRTRGGVVNLKRRSGATMVATMCASRRRHDAAGTTTPGLAPPGLALPGPSGREAK